MKYSEFVEQQVKFLKENSECADMEVVFRTDGSSDYFDSLEDIGPEKGDFYKGSFNSEEDLKSEGLSSNVIYDSLNSICIN